MVPLRWGAVLRRHGLIVELIGVAHGIEQRQQILGTAGELQVEASAALRPAVPAAGWLAGWDAVRSNGQASRRRLTASPDSVSRRVALAGGRVRQPGRRPQKAWFCREPGVVLRHVDPGLGFIRAVAQARRGKTFGPAGEAQQGQPAVFLTQGGPALADQFVPAGEHGGQLRLDAERADQQDGKPIAHRRHGRQQMQAARPQQFATSGKVTESSATRNASSDGCGTIQLRN